MKRLLGILAITALTASAFAQGTVALQNQTGLVRQWTSATDSTLITTPQNGAYVELICAPVGTTLANAFGTYSAGGFAANYSSLAGFLAANSGWSLAQGNPPATINGFGAGLFNGGGLTLPGIAGGANAEYMIVGWTGAFTTYEAAYASGTSFLGVSAIDTTVTGNPGTTPPGTAVSLRPTFTGITLAPIPEPTTFALAGLGLAALLVFRRRS
jgi:hypothetical protein